MFGIFRKFIICNKKNNSLLPVNISVVFVIPSVRIFNVLN